MRPLEPTTHFGYSGIQFHGFPKMLVTVQIPDQFARQFHLDDAAHSRQLLEAFVLQRFAEGELTSGQVGEALGLSFHETRQFLHDHNAPPDVTAQEHLQQMADLDEMISG